MYASAVISQSVLVNYLSVVKANVNTSKFVWKWTMCASAVSLQLALVRNWSVVKAHAKSGKIVRVVRGDGYGHDHGLI